MIALTEAGRSLQEEEIDKFEQDFDVRLPKDFKEFLRRHDGGRPVLDTVDIDGFNESPTDVQVVYGLYRPIKTSTLPWNIEWVKGLNLSWSLLPFACDSFGSRFCFDLADPQKPRVVFLDWNQDEPRTYDLAETFSHFLSKLRE